MPGYRKRKDVVREGLLDTRAENQGGKMVSKEIFALPFLDNHQARQSKKSQSKSAAEKFCFLKELCFKS